jgi:two-component system OmpR family response regulator
MVVRAGFGVRVGLPVMGRVLVVDDEPRIVSFVSRALSAHGFAVDGALDGLRAVQLAEAGTYELMVLDLLLPGLDGLSVLRRVTESRPDLPVLILSALSDVESKVAALELGAVDYLPKPFELAELVARVRTRLRVGTAPRPGNSLIAGLLTLDLMRRVATVEGLSPIALSEREFLLLQFLMRREDEVCTRDELLSGVWGYSFDPRSNVVDVYVGRLRSKLGADLIETVRNVGYRFVAP